MKLDLHLFVYQTIEKATFAGFLIRFRPTNANYITKEFSKYYFNAQMMRTYFVKEMNLVIRAFSKNY
jgi:type I restriction enzyme S subunit